MSDLIPKHGGYRKLLSFQIAQLAYDVTVRFCDRYISPRSRTHDQMVQAARSGVQNIAEGSQASATSKKTELKLTQVARASLEELKLDYEDFLRQRGLPQWEKEEPLRQSLIDRRCRTADEVAAWIKQAAGGQSARYAEISANAVLVLLAVACPLLDRQTTRLAQEFEQNGGFTERLYKVRTEKRGDTNPDLYDVHQVHFVHIATVIGQCEMWTDHAGTERDGYSGGGGTGWWKEPRYAAETHETGMEM
jgi:four helix bundle suffix protein